MLFRSSRKEGEDDTAKHDNRPFKADSGIGLDEALAHILAQLSRKGGEGDGSDCGIKV